MVKKKKTWWSCYKWYVIGVILLLFVVLVVLLIIMLNPFGLKGVTFSKESGFYNDSIEIELEPDGMLLVKQPAIKYNLNGDDLNDSGEWYNEPIRLESPEEGYALYSITAYACKDDGECTEPQVATYVLGKNLDEDVTLDIISINSAHKGLYDYETGIMVGGRTYDLNSTLGPLPFTMGNYNNRGKRWQRIASITRLDADGKIIWDEYGYIEISGGTSASYGIKSMKIILNHGKDHDESLETFRLRSGSQDQFSGNVRSSIVSRLAEESGFDGGVDTRRVVVFLNGEYYGIFDMQQNLSEYNLAKRFNIEKEKKIRKIKGPEDTVFNKFGLEKSIWDDLDLQENRDVLESKVDMDDYLKYFAIQILFNNTDWPMNNFEAWRYEGKSKTGNKYEDGRLRFIIYDTDLIYYTEGNIDWYDGAIGDVFRFLLESKYRGTGSSFGKVIKSDYYRERFIDIMGSLLKGPFKTENVSRIVDEEAEKIEHQVRLSSSDEEYEEWREQIELLRKAVSKREEEVKGIIKEFFKVEL